MNSFSPSVTQERKTDDSIMIDELLNDQTYHIEFNGHLTNHSKHAVIALAGLGVSPQKIRDYYENHAKQTAYGYGLEYAKPSKYEISLENWRHYLGQRTSFSSYCRFFDAEEKKLGMDGLLRCYLPSLLPGWAGAFTHATIHLGWGLSIGNRHMIMEGLAYMAFSYVSCHPERLSSNTSSVTNDNTPMDSLLRIAGNWDERREELKKWVSKVLNENSSNVASNIHPELKRSGLQYRIARMLAHGHPLIYEAHPWMRQQEESKLWEELYFAVSLLYLSIPGDFVLLHLITSLYAMEKISDHLPADQKRQVIECYWIGMLSIIFAGGVFPKRAKLNSLNEIYKGSVDAIDSSAIEQDWKQIVARSVEEEEEHNPKLVYVLKRAWQLSTGKTIYRTASSQFTKTPDLPASFEQPPIDEQELEEYYKKASSAKLILEGHVHLLPQTNHLRALHSIIRDKNASREDFIFYSGRIFHQLIEKSIDFIPFEACDVMTPIGACYNGLRISQKICGVSVMRAGESLEGALREAFTSIKIGKILIQRDKITKLPRLYYVALPDDIAKCTVLLMDPMLATGGTALAALDILADKGVLQKNIIFINLISVSEGINTVHNKYPEVKIVTSAIDEKLNENAYMIPGIGDFGDRYFGTDK